LPMPDAPGLTFFGAEADPAVLGASVVGFPLGGCAGSGLTPSHAFESCVGEGIEFLSQFAQPGDALQAATLDAPPVPLDPGSDRFVRAVFAACTIPADRSVDWVPVRRMSDGTSCWFPADLCLRRTGADFVPPLKLSTGCAAGVSREDATLRAMLELVERDAAALWWRGGRRGRPIVPASEAATVAATLLAKVRRGQGDRRTVLLDITTDLGVPVVAAFSARPDGYGFALGLGARTSLAEATGSAILELCQSELGKSRVRRCWTREPVRCYSRMMPRPRHPRHCPTTRPRRSRDCWQRAGSLPIRSTSHGLGSRSRWSARSRRACSWIHATSSAIGWRGRSPKPAAERHIPPGSCCCRTRYTAAVAAKRVLAKASSDAGSTPSRIAGASARACAPARVTPLWHVAANAPGNRSDCS
jgi:hypothetical protein